MRDERLVIVLGFLVAMSFILSATSCEMTRLKVECYKATTKAECLE
jgi:hypothetical protein